jgi:hypothetical protein
MTDEGKRYFTPAEVERLIPRLTALIGPVMEAHAEATGLRTELQEGQRRVMLTGGARLDLEFWRSRKARFDRATTVVQRGLGAILELGGAPKDLELGLVDFLGRVGGRDVSLCWRHGEDAIRFWHGLDEGYAARKPLPDG